MSDSPLLVHLDRSADGVPKKLFTESADHVAAATSASHSPIGNGRTPGRGTARLRMERLRNTGVRPNTEASESSSLASTFRTTSAKDDGLTAGALAPPTPASALSPHVGTASEMELVQFAASQGSDSPPRPATRHPHGATTTGSAGTSTEGGPRPLNPSQLQSEAASPTDSATRHRSIAQRFLHQRGASATSNSCFNSRPTTPVSSRLSRTGSLSLAGRSPCRSTYLEAGEAVTEKDRQNQLRSQRVDRQIMGDIESSERNDIKREEADAIMAIMSSHRSIAEANGMVLRRSLNTARSTPFASGQQTPTSGRHLPRGETSRLSESASPLSTSPADRMSGSPATPAARTPHRPTLTFNPGEDDDPLAEVHFVASMSSFSKDGAAHTSPSGASSHPSSPLNAVRRASSIEVEKAQALIEEAKEMLSSSSHVSRRQSSMARSPAKFVESDNDTEASDEAQLFAATSTALPALASTMKPLSHDGLERYSHLISPRFTNPPQSPRTPRTHDGAPPSASATLAQGMSYALSQTRASRVLERPPRGYDASIQYVVITYPSFYWLSQSRWFDYLVKVPLAWATKLGLLGCALWLVYTLLCVIQEMVMGAKE